MTSNLSDHKKWLACSLDRDHHYTPTYEAAVYFDGPGDIDRECARNDDRQRIAHISSKDRTADQKRLALSVHTFTHMDSGSTKKEHTMIDTKSVHGHTSRLFQQMTDVAMNMDSNASHDVVAPIITPDMKSAFYKFCSLYTSESVVNQPTSDYDAY